MRERRVDTTNIPDLGTTKGWVRGLMYRPATHDRLPGMSLPVELSIELTNYKNDSETAIQEIATRSVVSAIPYAGSAMIELFNGLAQRRTQERLNGVFDQIKSRLDNLGEEKVDQGFFHSEEFQTLLFLLLEKLHTTHEKERLRMFGNALANSGRRDFQADDKEQYIRVLRELSLTDLNILNDGRLYGWAPQIQPIDSEPEVMVSLSRLHGMGLVLDKLHAKGTQPVGSGPMAGRIALENLLTQPPKKVFYRSEFGEKFLSFISAEARSEAPSQ
jgi:hypothetical protein